MKDELATMTNEELWRLFPIVLCEHDEGWKARYEAERALLLQAVGEDRIARLSHIGSTAVAGLLCKPTIDILLEIRNDCGLPSLQRAMGRCGYRPSPQPKNPPPHLMYLKGYTPSGFSGQCFHVHVRYFGDWPELYFRDYLIGHPDIASAYGALKAALWHTYEHDRDGYTQAKTEFVKRYTELARREFDGKYR